MSQAVKKLFTEYSWQYSYKTSATGPDGRLINMLHDFYIPILKRSNRYDRVAGYFRSSSLAAASQGFSAFRKAGGRIRMIVGADLKENDVTAILEGNQKLLADQLDREVQTAGDWPQDVSRGVDLLCWMVARGVLEIKVAFRVHGETGKPIPFSSADDGYVHEKWAVFKDGADNRIYISGSLNESQKALVRNAENIDVHADWWGEIERKRVIEAEREFESLWNNQTPHMRVMTLPEAVKNRMIAIGEKIKYPIEIDGTSARPKPVSPPSPRERLQFALIKDGPKLPGGRFVGLETAPVEPWPHQEVVARRLIETWPCSHLMCDEVGLGKTIEAGLAIRSLYLSGIAKRVLIAPPASLTKQWHREMASKFFLPFARSSATGGIRHERLHPVEETDESKNLYSPDLNIVSTGLFSRKERQKEIKAAEPFDMVLIDEAHYARRKDPKNGTRSHPGFGNLYRTLSERLRHKTRCLWLATATPMQLDWIEVFDLQALTRRVGLFQRDPSLFWVYYQALGSLVGETNPTAQQWELLRRAIDHIQSQDPFLWRYLEESVIDGRMRNAVKRWLSRGTVPRGADRRNIQRLIFAAAPVSRVMLRHGRDLLEIYRKNGQLGANLARREILPVPRIVLTGLEKQAYESLESYCSKLTDQIAANSTDKKWINSLGLYLSFLRLRLASSLFAIRETLKRRLEKVRATRLYQVNEGQEAVSSDDLEWDLSGDEEPDESILENLLKNRTDKDLAWEEKRLKQIIEPLVDLSGMPLKMKELLRVLDRRRIKPGSRIKQTVIFTRFFDTLKDLVERLRQIDPSMLIGTYSGQGGRYVDPATRRWRGVERDEIKHRFLRGEIDVLVCTDAAAEGLNLQTANLLVNYDLPWNPMKVEQRIGRIDRIGQKYDRVYVLNLCYADSAEQIVYERLLQRLIQAGHVVGTQQISMLPVTRDEFNELAAGDLSAEVLESRAKDRIKVQQQRTRSMEIGASDLYDIYMRMKEKRSLKSCGVTLATLWEVLANSVFLKDSGCTVKNDKGVQTLTLRGVSDVTDGALLTADRIQYEKGSEHEGVLHFASYGGPVFDDLISTVDRFELPPCIHRISEIVTGTQIEVAAYATKRIQKDGTPGVCLITSLDQVKDLTLDENATIDQKDLTSLKEQLHEIVRQEFAPMLAVSRIENLNQRAAYAHALFEMIIARCIFVPSVVAESDNFWAAIKDMDRRCNDKDQMMVPKMPVRILRKIQDDLLFDIAVPRVGDETSPSLPIILIQSALDAACRLADGAKVARSRLTVEAMLRRMDKEIERLLGRYKAEG